MSGCVSCGRSTPRRKCRACEADERAEERADNRNHHNPECPSCGGTTSGEGVECYRCRRDGDRVETDGGSIRGLKAADDIERHLRNVLDETDCEEARYHARHALQHLERDVER